MQKRPIYPIHPGEILADELAELNKNPTELARELHVPANRISQLVAGKRAISVAPQWGRKETSGIHSSTLKLQDVVQSSNA